jgi:hypothetical protein
MLIGHLPSDLLSKSLLLRLGKVVYYGTPKANTDRQASDSSASTHREKVRLRV